MSDDRVTVGSPVSKTEYVLSRLRQEIADGTLTAGTSLRQSDLAVRFGVSATPVREALRLLESEGTITYVTHRGATVAEMSDDRIHHLYMVRARLEGLACSISATQMTEEAIDQADSIQARLRATDGVGDRSDLSRLNREFHFAVYESGSPLVAGYVKAVWTAIPTESSVWSTRSAACFFISQHEDILQALKDRDAETADVLMQAHIMAAAEIRRGTFRPPAPPRRQRRRRT